VGLYARVSTHDQQTLPMQLSAMRAYARRRGWKVREQLEKARDGGKEPSFMRLAGSVHGVRDLSTGKGFSRS
jgi:DNA invertase Pin-like site-specific DNA recombinase